MCNFSEKYGKIPSRTNIAYKHIETLFVKRNITEYTGGH
jgi:hypothetical protein